MKKLICVLIGILCAIPLSVSAANLVGEYDDTLFGISYTIKLYVDNGSYSIKISYRDGSGSTETCESYSLPNGIKLVCNNHRFNDYYLLNKNNDLEQRDDEGIVDVLKNKIKPKNTIKSTGNEESCYSLGERFGRCSGLVLKGKTCPPEDDFEMPERCRNKDETEKGIKHGLGSVW